MPEIQHPLGTTYYETSGDNKKRPALICLHGGPGGDSIYHREFLKLGKDRQVFIYDQIGCGRSSHIDKSKFTIETFVKELGYLVDAWGLKEFCLLGSSWGCSLALEYYFRSKDKRLVSMVLQSPLVNSKDWKNDANTLIKGLPKKTQDIINNSHRDGTTDSPEYKGATHEYELKHVLRNKTKLLEPSPIKNSGGGEIYSYMWGPSEFKPTGTLSNYNREGELKDIDIPVFFICGEHDEARPKTIKKYHGLTKGSKFKMIKDASHCITSEKPGVLLKLVKEFLSP